MSKAICTVIVAAALLLTPVGAANAATVGIADQSPAMFTDPNFKRLAVEQSRLIVPYDVISRPNDRAQTDQWIAAARAAGVLPLISFEHSRINPRKRPSVAEYTKAFKAFRQRYPFINTYSPFNEANHQSQPTFHRPRLAARYYNAVRANCRGCKIVALDVLDQGGMIQYVKAFKKTARRPTIWGLHNYRDTNRFRKSGTKALLKITKGQIWLTEAGGIVSFSSAFPYNESRAARALKHMFKLARLNKRIRRLYIYAWFGEPRGARFDAGLVGPNGARRPGYLVVKNNLRR